MGMFDTVIATCPRCAKDIEFQSKAGSCSLKRYYILSVPIVIAENLSEMKKKCSCGQIIKIINPEKSLRVAIDISDPEEKIRKFD